MGNKTYLFQYELGLPIFVRVGTVGKLSLNIPWNRLCNQTAVVTIEVGQQLEVFFINLKVFKFKEWFIKIVRYEPVPIF